MASPGRAPPRAFGGRAEASPKTEAIKAGSRRRALAPPYGLSFKNAALEPYVRRASFTMDDGLYKAMEEAMARSANPIDLHSLLHL